MRLRLMLCDWYWLNLLKSSWLSWSHFLLIFLCKETILASSYMQKLILYLYTDQLPDAINIVANTTMFFIINCMKFFKKKTIKFYLYFTSSKKSIFSYKSKHFYGSNSFLYESDSSSLLIIHRSDKVLNSFQY